ncbi:hypothetical protein RZS08_23505, partial [Arthrospira platensis SPKY1]|nr:hypothetical protein [Arthrospira platensis SPKY1]
YGRMDKVEYSACDSPSSIIQHGFEIRENAPELRCGTRRWLGRMFVPAPDACISFQEKPNTVIIRNALSLAQAIPKTTSPTMTFPTSVLP